MDTQPQRGIGLLGMAMLLGILGDALLRATPWGINLFVWLAVALAAGWALLPDRPTDHPLTGWPLLPALFFAACVGWRDAQALTFWNAVAVLCALSLPVLHRRGVRLRLARTADYLMGLATAGVGVMAGPMLLAPGDAAWGGILRQRKRAASIAVGAVLAAPLLLVFGGLLASADPGFERLVRSLVDWDFGTLFSHFVLWGFLAWTSAGYLRSLVARRDPVFEMGTALVARSPRRPSLGLLEIGIPLGTLISLFGVFIALQVRYLFGGEAVILATAGMTYAEYARSGFFELVAVSALVLPVLLLADWTVDQGNARQVTVFRALAGTMVVLNGLIMLSAAQRMWLYVDAYGLTQDRVHATTFMLWIGLLLGYFAATVLRGRRSGFPFGVVSSGFAVLAMLNFVNPDALVARVNLSRAEAGEEFDAQYVRRLSADAVPQLATRLAVLPEAARCEVFRGTIERWAGEGRGDWRSWNLGRSRARWAARRADIDRESCE